jgi:putative peptidoglycan lipid II flippase
MPFFSIVSLTTRAFYALKDTVTPVKLAALSFVINLVLSWWLKDVIGAPGLVISSTVAIVVQTLVMQRMLARRLPAMEFGELWTTIGKVVIATIAMSAVVWIGWRGLQMSMTHLRRADLVAILALIPLGTLVYGAGLWILRVEGRAELTAVYQRIRYGRK